MKSLQHESANDRLVKSFVISLFRGGVFCWVKILYPSNTIV